MVVPAISALFVLLAVPGDGASATPHRTVSSYVPGGSAMVGTWAPTGSLSVPRYIFTMTRLTDGRVLVAGGRDAAGNQLSSAELYDPATGEWSFTGSMSQPREGHSATLLPTGQVLV